jgi:hypothetical protein
VGSVVDRTALGQVCSEYFSFPCQSFIPLTAPQSSSSSSSPPYIIQGWYNRPICGRSNSGLIKGRCRGHRSLMRTTEIGYDGLANRIVGSTRQGENETKYMRLHTRGTMLQSGRSLRSLNYCNWPNPSNSVTVCGVDSTSNRNEYQESS